MMEIRSIFELKPIIINSQKSLNTKRAALIFGVKTLKPEIDCSRTNWTINTVIQDRAEITVQNLIYTFLINLIDSAKTRNTTMKIYIELLISLPNTSSAKNWASA